jgi:hypothetical protein
MRIPLKHLFTVISGLVLLIAAGMASQGAGFLVQADILPAWGSALWDTSALLDESSIPGKILHTLMGYVSRPSGMQLFFYLSTLIITGTLMHAYKLSPKSVFKVKKSIAAAVAAGLGLLVVPTMAKADFQVRSPIVEYREMEIEYNGAHAWDSRNDRNNDRSHTISIGYGFTSFWKAELEGEMEGGPGEETRYAATTLENTFQLAEQGRYWLDSGLFLEYSHAKLAGEPDVVEFGPLLQKEAPGFAKYGTLHTLNLLLERTIGSDRTHETTFSYAWQSRLRFNPRFEPGFEVYGEIEDLRHAGKFSQQGHRAGPMFAGTYNLPTPGKVKYELGYLLPLTAATEDGVARWKLEYELPF